MQARLFHPTPRLAPVSRSLTEIDFAANIQPGSVALSNQLVYCETMTHRCHIAQTSHPGQAIFNLPSKRQDSSPV